MIDALLAVLVLGVVAIAIVVDALALVDWLLQRRWR
jgi:hypothetical protein